MKSAVFAFLICTIIFASPAFSETMCPDGQLYADKKCAALPDVKLPEEKAEPLTNEEIKLPLESFAKKFAPCMTFAGPDIWPVDVSYLWSKGAHLKRVKVSPKGKILEEQTVVQTSRLGKINLMNVLVTKDDDDTVQYSVDGPGDNTGPGKDEATWMVEWQEIQKTPNIPSKAPYPPLVYVHFYWFNKAEDILVIQYWFYYPYDKWVNNHEGDWEHINVLLKLKGKNQNEKLDAAKNNQEPVFYHFNFHGFSLDAFTEVTRIGGNANGDHVVVFVGGEGSSIWSPGWTGLYSGGSYPAAGKFYIAGFTDDTTKPARFLHAKDINVTMLYELAQMDFDKTPQLSWAPLNFCAGQPVVEKNSPVVAKASGYQGCPSQPYRKGSWSKGFTGSEWVKNKESFMTNIAFPQNWKIIYSPIFK